MVCSTLSARCVGVHICRMSIDAHMYAFMESKSQVLWGRKQWGEGRLLYGRRDVLCLSCPQYNVHVCTCVPCMCACAYRQIQRWIRCTCTKNTHYAHGQVPWRASTKQGAMLIMLHMDHKGPVSCDHHCVDTLGMTATFGVKFLKSTRSDLAQYMRLALTFWEFVPCVRGLVVSGGLPALRRRLRTVGSLETDSRVGAQWQGLHGGSRQEDGEARRQRVRRVGLPS